MNLFTNFVLLISITAPPVLVLGVEGDIEDAFSNLNAVPCSANGMVSAWCDSSVMDVECSLLPTLDVYACRCHDDPSACPEDCIPPEDLAMDQDPLAPMLTHHGILCRGIPEDEPNYVLKTDVSSLPLHHCENNGIVANWCNEATVAGVDCLLLSALDEYVCTCRSNSAACPSDCVGGTTPDRKTKFAVRCSGIPLDTPNYILE